MKDTKICKVCLIEKSVLEFHIARKPGTMNSNGYLSKVVCYKSSCKECLREQQRKKYHSLTLEEQRKLRKNNSCNNPDYRKKYKLKNYYGLTTEEFSSMVLEQNNKCKICECEMKSTQIDHNHSTGKVRGLLCRNCNTSLGLLKENTKVLYNMISYINNDYI
jgi:Recombination endonuclease VII